MTPAIAPRMAPVGAPYTPPTAKASLSRTVTEIANHPTTAKISPVTTILRRFPPIAPAIADPTPVMNPKGQSEWNSETVDMVKTPTVVPKIAPTRAASSLSRGVGGPGTVAEGSLVVTG